MTTITLDLVRLLAFILGFLLISGLTWLSWNAWRTRAETDADNRVLLGIAGFSAGTAVLVISTMAHVTDQVHRRRVKWITPTLIVAEITMIVGLWLVLRGQQKRALQGPTSGVRVVRRPVTEHPLDEMTTQVKGRGDAG